MAVMVDRLSQQIDHPGIILSISIVHVPSVNPLARSTPIKTTVSFLLGI
jgi:hypothetical protein